MSGLEQTSGLGKYSLRKLFSRPTSAVVPGCLGRTPPSPPPSPAPPGCPPVWSARLAAALHLARNKVQRSGFISAASQRARLTGGTGAIQEMQR